MGIGLLLALGLAAAGCAGTSRERSAPNPVNVAATSPSDETAENEPVANRVAELPVVPQSPLVEVEEHPDITTIRSALAYIMRPTDSEQPMIIAFGEIHDDCMVDRNDNIRCLSFSTAADYMANEIFPFLSSRRIQDHVSEFFRNDPVVDQQIAVFLRRGSFGPNLSDFMGGRDFCPILTMLQGMRRQRRSGIRSQLYGTHLSLLELPDSSRLDEVYGDRMEQVWIRLRDYAYARIIAVVRQGRSVYFHGGADHIDPDPTEAMAVRSFGDELAQEYGDSYQAVFLVVLDLVGRYPLHPALARLPNWQEYVDQAPQEGIIFLTTEVDGEHSMSYILFSRTPNARVLRDDEVYSCRQPRVIP